jgi:uncharacterized glyoxalase superfamily protein PhnB
MSPDMSPDKSTPPPNVWPTVSAHDALALISFLTEALGFEATAVYAEGETVHHAELSWPPGGGIMLGSVRPDSLTAAPGTLSVYAVTDEPDALCARARAAGATITKEPFDTDYGSRDFALRDVEGNRWSFGTYRGEPRT